MGLHASSTVPLTLEDCSVPLEHRIGQEGDGFRIAMAALDGGRIGIASQAFMKARAGTRRWTRPAGR